MKKSRTKMTIEYMAELALSLFSAIYALSRREENHKK